MVSEEHRRGLAARGAGRHRGVVGREGRRYRQSQGQDGGGHLQLVRGEDGDARQKPEHIKAGWIALLSDPGNKVEQWRGQSVVWQFRGLLADSGTAKEKSVVKKAAYKTNTLEAQNKALQVAKDFVGKAVSSSDARLELLMGAACSSKSVLVPEELITSVISSELDLLDSGEIGALAVEQAKREQERQEAIAKLNQEDLIDAGILAVQEGDIPLDLVEELAKLKKKAICQHETFPNSNFEFHRVFCVTDFEYWGCVRVLSESALLCQVA